MDSLEESDIDSEVFLVFFMVKKKMLFKREWKLLGGSLRGNSCLGMFSVEGGSIFFILWVVVSKFE